MSYNHGVFGADIDAFVESRPSPGFCAVLYPYTLCRVFHCMRADGIASSPPCIYRGTLDTMPKYVYNEDDAVETG